MLSERVVRTGPVVGAERRGRVEVDELTWRPFGRREPVLVE